LDLVNGINSIGNKSLDDKNGLVIFEKSGTDSLGIDGKLGTYGFGKDQELVKELAFSGKNKEMSSLKTNTKYKIGKP
jgi:hypothetical protein